MGIYNRYILPRVIHFTCGLKPNMRQREKIIPMAEGRVLEIGIGSGLNLPYYDATKVDKVIGLDPSLEITQMAKDIALKASFDVEFIGLPGEEIPLDSKSIDTLVMTYTLCSISDYLKALKQMLRVLKPGGKLVFCEHGLAPDPVVEKWQHRLTPVWKRLGGGCHLDRNIPALLREGGFNHIELETMYIPGWKPVSFNYWGIAKP
ncbi:class I SAM-dependent methyltransferase [Aliikangiella sp. G2MR2-5]|uniref:class I SAM-dependent methyltransferase n=1 Tax=Aliikangiella sp. G2MR2-5 TaxID=2788943 RepID=UPI0018AABB17|nr:class I SAM-dependent methyltransferase [Aliikangiella sp. G2MR2-5]